MSSSKDIIKDDVVSSSDTPYQSNQSDTTPKQSIGSSFINSFKRLEFDESLLTPDMTEAEKIEVRLAHTPLQRSLKQRHLQMISIGSSVGTGLFVGSGSALRTGGAASLPIAWSIVGTFLFAVIHALGELAVTYPTPGAFSAYATKFIDPSWGFAMGWNYVFLWLVVLPLEVIAASLTIQFWNESINPVAWVVIFYVLIMTINLFGVKGYGEAEFIFSLIKVVAIIGFLILGIVLVCGGGPSGGFVGGKYYHDPGAFTHGFKGFCSVLVVASYALGGSELIGVTAAETKNPRKSLPSAIKQVFWRLMLFYLGGLTLVSLLVKATDKRLLSSSSADASASPFVIAIKNGGIKGLPSVMNVVILISVLSVGNSAVYGCSRTLTSLAAQGLAPSIFGYIDRMGRPIFGIALNGISGLLCFIVANRKIQNEVFTWLLAICGLCIIFTWLTISICHVRFRLAMKAQGRSLRDLAFTSHAGFWGSVYAIVLMILVLIAQFWISLFPIGGQPNARAFFENYIGFPVFFALYFGRKLWTRKFWEFTPLNQINLDSGRKDVDTDLLRQELDEEKEYIKSRPFWYRTYRFWC
ncbi:putative histidine permease [Wickerhamomyces ciferrii]|uniref:Histidine permease n=1 Tax=Wickerhamomyces ciferrii (strain ATCC 14091 / BCRC 22168 / CBS 111 / JCM 3599 / NBRC 0793 / NRRL Y-1031 F-60-10) TaxID=1206466 RepID=K0KGE7_WICCF|nr:putative histidine permease [Wickerhamomyces ciferrii]CCH44235.1 putative histidine permease [Wickerhamomyces ciferrii]